MSQSDNLDIMIANIAQAVRDLSYELGIKIDIFDIRALEDHTGCNLVIWINSQLLKEIMIKKDLATSKHIKIYLKKIFTELGILDAISSR